MRLRLDSDRTFWWLLTLVAIVGAGLRLAFLSTLPSGVYLDEAANLMDGLRAWEAGGLAWFYPDSYGRGLVQEGMFTNLQVLSVEMLGPSVFALRLPAALAGVVAVLGAGWMTREALRSPGAGLVAAWLVAVAYWPLNFSRIAFSAALLPSVIALGVAALIVAVRRRSYWWSASSGLLFALSLYTYAASRVVPILLLVLLAFAVWWSRPLSRERRRQLGLFSASFLIACVPFLIGVARIPDALFLRSQNVSVRWSGDILTTVGELSDNLGLALGKYLFFADPNFRHGFPPLPVLDYLTGLLFFIGLFMAVYGVWRGIAQRAPLGSDEAGAGTFELFLLVSGFLVFLIPEVLANDSNPHALRAIGTMPFVFALVAMALLDMKRIISTRWTESIGSILVLLTLVLMTAANLSTYFLLFSRSEQAQEAFDPSLSDFAKSVALSGCETVEVDGLQLPETAVVDFFLVDTPVTTKYVMGGADEPTFQCVAPI